MVAYACMNRSDLAKIFDLLMHDGLYVSNPKLFNDVTLNKKGAVFVVRNKSDFACAGVKGFIVTTKETLLEQAHKLSHFTPNIYRKFGYADAARKKIKGFEERNLLQINTFAVDIDTKRYSVNELLLACIDDSVGAPTFILQTTRGYQLFFVLRKPIYLSNNKNYLSLTVAKRIAENLKRSLAHVEADMNCNDFGFFRVPNEHNIVWFNENFTYEPAELINWSQRKDNDMNRHLYVVSNKSEKAPILHSDWFHKLITTTDIKGQKGQIGRNNYLFTLALLCFQDGKDKAFAYDLLDEFNTRMKYPVQPQDVVKVIESAYSGRYFGAKKEYIEQLLELYSLTGDSVAITFGNSCWYKHKKAREDRKNSHFYEWENDIIDFITAEKDVSEPFIWRTQKALCEAIGISNSSLNYLLKHSKKLIKTVKGKGRNAQTGWTTVEHYLAYIIWLKKQKGQQIIDFIPTLVKQHVQAMEPVAGYPLLCRALKQKLRSESIQLSLVTGYVS